MISLLIKIVIVIVAVVIYQRVRSSNKKASSLRYSPSRHWSLALAQPMAEAKGPTNFYNPSADGMDDSGNIFFRGMLLHQLGYRLDTRDEEIRSKLAQEFEGRWFRLDLHALRPEDDPRAALAFACVRVAHLARTVEMMGWVESAVAWRVLLLNAQRAQECFTGWEDFGRAYITGREQWVMASRADPMGEYFNEDKLRALLMSHQEGWAGLSWPGAKLKLPFA